MRQNSFFFTKAESATNDFKAEDFVNTLQVIREDREPLLLHSQLPSPLWSQSEGCVGDLGVRVGEGRWGSRQKV